MELDRLTRAADLDDADKAARQLEAYFLRQLLTQVRGDGPSPLGGGFAGATFRAMLDEAMADRMAAGGGVGLAPTFRRELDIDQRKLKSR
jgi:Rod binding domain-containing protein